MKNELGSTKAVRNRIKKVHKAFMLPSVFMSGQYPDGRTTDKRQSFEGRDYYVGYGYDRFKIATRFKEFLWVHTVTRHLSGQVKELLGKDDGTIMRHPADENSLPVFTVPHVPHAGTHFNNAIYLADRVGSYENVGRLKTEWSINYRTDKFKHATKQLENYCSFFGIPTPEITLSSGKAVVKSANARKALLKIKNGGTWHEVK